MKIGKTVGAMINSDNGDERDAVRLYDEAIKQKARQTTRHSVQAQPSCHVLPAGRR
jgi:hypothetical protein